MEVDNVLLLISSITVFKRKIKKDNVFMFLTNSKLTTEEIPSKLQGTWPTSISNSIKGGKKMEKTS